MVPMYPIFKWRELLLQPFSEPFRNVQKWPVCSTVEYAKIQCSQPPQTLEPPRTNTTTQTTNCGKVSKWTTSRLWVLTNDEWKAYFFCIFNHLIINSNTPWGVLCSQILTTRFIFLNPLPPQMRAIERFREGFGWRKVFEMEGKAWGVYILPLNRVPWPWNHSQTFFHGWFTL